MVAAFLLTCCNNPIVMSSSEAYRDAVLRRGKFKTFPILFSAKQ